MKETTPIFTVIQLVVVPVERSAPKRNIICVAFLLLGGTLSVILVLGLPFVAEITSAKWLKSWLPKNERQNSDTDCV